MGFQHDPRVRPTGRRCGGHGQHQTYPSTRAGSFHCQHRKDASQARFHVRRRASDDLPGVPNGQLAVFLSNAGHVEEFLPTACPLIGRIHHHHIERVVRRPQGISVGRGGTHQGGGMRRLGVRPAEEIPKFSLAEELHRSRPAFALADRYHTDVCVLIGDAGSHVRQSGGCQVSGDRGYVYPREPALHHLLVKTLPQVWRKGAPGPPVCGPQEGTGAAGEVSYQESGGGGALVEPIKSSGRTNLAKNSAISGLV